MHMRACTRAHTHTHTHTRTHTHTYAHTHKTHTQTHIHTHAHNTHTHTCTQSWTNTLQLTKKRPQDADVLCPFLISNSFTLLQVREWLMSRGRHDFQKDTHAARSRSLEEGEEQEGHTQDIKRARLERSSTPTHEPSGMSKQERQGDKHKPRSPTGPPKKGITKWVDMDGWFQQKSCCYSTFHLTNVKCSLNMYATEIGRFITLSLSPSFATFCRKAEVADLIGKEVDVPGSVFHDHTPESFFRWVGPTWEHCFHPLLYST